jgi:hypothetical protein
MTYPSDTEYMSTVYLQCYTDDVTLLGGNIHTTIKKNTKTLIDTSKEVVLEVNTEKTKYMLVSSPECRAKS